MRRLATMGAGVLLLLTGFLASHLLGRVGASGAPDAEIVPDQAQETEYESDPEVIQRVLTGGVPMGRWKEGLLFEASSPSPG